MSGVDQGWMVDDGPDTLGCGLGEHDWRAADCECGNPECWVVCENCGEEERECEDLG